MSVFLDYYKVEGEIQLLTIMTEDGSFIDYDGPDFSDVVSYLMEPGFVVVFGITRAPLERLLKDDPRLEDFALRYRWLDVQAEIRKQCGLRPTLRNLQAATSGETEGKWSDMARREYADYTSDIVLNRVQVAHDRLAALKDCYDYAMLHGQISFYHKDEQFLVDLEWTEPGHPMNIEHTGEGIERTRDF